MFLVVFIVSTLCNSFLFAVDYAYWGIWLSFRTAVSMSLRSTARTNPLW